MKQIIINGHDLTDGIRAYVIAEIGHNHQGKMELAKQMFKAAAEAGASAVKLQKRFNKTLFTKTMYDQPYDNPNSYGATYGEHRDALEFDNAEYAELKDYAQSLELDFFATPFDFESADFLAKLEMPAYKLASADLKNTPLQKHIAAFKRPIFLSTGGGTIEDIRRAVNAIVPINPQLVVLHCTASYPADIADMHLRVIQTLQTEFPELLIGLSDHENGIDAASVAYMLGARVFEKHFTLNRAWKGTDHSFSLEPEGMRKLVRNLQRIPVMLGSPEKQVLEVEKKPIEKMGKSIVAARDLAAGSKLARHDLSLKSPGGGIPPYQLDDIIGKILKADLKEDDLVRLEYLS